MLRQEQTKSKKAVPNHRYGYGNLVYSRGKCTTRGKSNMSGKPNLRLNDMLIPC